MRIIVDGIGGVKLVSEQGYEKWLKKNQRMCLLDSDGDQIDFESLVDGGKYTLGPPAKIPHASKGLRLFQLEFKSIPTGSSGVPHVHEELEDFPMEQLRSFQPLECTTPLYQQHHQPDNEKDQVFYSREIQVQIHVSTLMKDVIRSCNYNLSPDTEAALNGLKIDIGFLRNEGDDICGTIEVKQPKRANAVPPDPDPMCHPKVVTQVLDQMIPLRTLYGVKNVYGILSTYKSWRFFRWVPSEEETENLDLLRQMVDEISLSPLSSSGTSNLFVTPQKAHGGVDGGSSRKSPPASPQPYVDADGDENLEEEDEDGFSEDNIKRGTLYASDVISEESVALKLFAWVLGEMAQSPIEHIPAYQRDFLYAVRKDAPSG